ncbi:hypothetical protein OG871_03775 [Kitasatospora sp. NBC_00374]|uniref:hypothetical protein n=1 Tax=Kitasatospora sp. NBC_00374 TaxID=2975964 RepID=UPI0032550D08
MDTAALETTRRSLHAVAELLMAGPQYRASGTIRLRVVPGGFATVAEPALAVHGTDLVSGERRLPLPGASCAALARELGVEAGQPAGLYGEGSGAGVQDGLRLDPAAAEHLLARFAAGDTALRRFAPDQEPVLWPEHFDLGITVDAVNYGVSPGDSFSPEPYAYVGPWTRRVGVFWNAPFGATRPMDELAGAEAVQAFFTEGRGRAATDPPAADS